MHPLRLGIVALLVAVLIPAIAVAQNSAPTHHGASPPKYHFVANYLDPTVFIEHSAMHTRTAWHTQRWIDRQHRLAKLRRQRRLARLRAAHQGALTAAARSATTAAPHLASPAPAVQSGSVNWDAIAQCESGGRWDLNSGNGFWGGLQFTPGTWFAYGGGPFDGVGPFPYSREQQIAVANRVLASQGIGAWPYCGRFG